MWRVHGSLCVCVPVQRTGLAWSGLGWSRGRFVEIRGVPESTYVWLVLLKCQSPVLRCLWFPMLLDYVIKAILRESVSQVLQMVEIGKRTGNWGKLSWGGSCPRLCGWEFGSHWQS